MANTSDHYNSCLWRLLPSDHPREINYLCCCDLGYIHRVHNGRGGVKHSENREKIKRSKYRNQETLDKKLVKIISREVY